MKNRHCMNIFSFLVIILFMHTSALYNRFIPVVNKYVICCCSVAQSCLTLCNCSTPGFLVHHQLKLMSIKSVMPYSHLILCCPLLLLSSVFPSIRFFSNESALSIGTSTSASVLPVNIQDWFPVGWTSWISLQSKGLSRVFSNTTVQKHQFFSAQVSSQSNSHIHTWPLEKP